MTRRVLLVDDDELFTSSVRDYLAPDDLTVEVAPDCATAEQCLREARWDAITLDQHLPDGTGLELAARLTATQRVPIIMVTGKADMGDALLGLDGGIHDYLIKPVDLPQLRFVIHRCVKSSVLERAASLAHRQRLDTAGIETANAALAETIDLALRAAQRPSPILIGGETGTGKTRLARAIHDASSVADGPFVSVNCGAIPANLVEAELFGSVEGAFTGATTRPGLFELATGGTLFLDEIGELPLAAQATLLSVIEEGRVRRVGAQREMKVDVRILAASHVSLEEAAERKEFRADLLYRLDVLSVTLPPLRDRLEDLEALVRDILAAQRAEGRPAAELADGELEALARYPWPGNIRELRNVLERSLLLADGATLRPSRFIVARGARPSPTPTDEPLPLEEVERRHILRTLDQFGGRRDRTAVALGISVATLRRRLTSYRGRSD